MRLLKYMVLVICLFGLFGLPLSLSNRSKTSKDYHILLLNSFHADFRQAEESIAGLKETLEESIPGISTHVIFMDTMRYSESIAWPLVYKALTVKYKNIKTPTFIVAMGNSALEFLLEYKNEFFPNVPIIFSCINFFDPAMIKGYEDHITGVTEDFSFRSTARIMLQLHPNLERVVVLYSETLTGRLLKIKMQKEIDNIFNAADIKVEHVINYTYDELKSLLIAMKKDEAIIYTGIQRDRNGNIFSNTEAEIVFLQNSIPNDVPLYSFWTIYDSIMVGGLLFDGRTNGIQVGKKLVNLIRGMDIKHSPVEPPIVKKMFYYDKLIKFGIKEDRLPQDAIIVGKNYHQTFIKKYGLWFLLITVMQILMFLYWFAFKRNGNIINIDN